MEKMKIRYEDITGQKFNRWTVVSFAYSKEFSKNQTHSKRTFWNCICDCGNKGIVRGEYLKSGKAKSCGCYRMDVISTNNGRTKHPLYRIWWGIVRRCTKKGTEHYKDYGGRGIHLCDCWLDFDCFVADIENLIGKRPSNEYTLNRVDNDGHYEPKNVKWSTWEEQAKNRRIPKSLSNYSDNEIVMEFHKRNLYEKAASSSCYY